MLKFKKALKSKIILVLISGVFFVTNTAYGIDLSGNTHLRKQLDFDTIKTSPKYLCAMIATAIHINILDGNSNVSPKNILETAIEKDGPPDLFQKIEQSGIKIEKDKKGTIWVYCELENIYIAIQKDGQFAPPKDIKTFRKAKIKEQGKKLTLEGKFYIKKSKLKKIFVKAMLTGVIGLTLLTTASISLWNHISYDPYQNVKYGNMQAYEDDKKETASWSGIFGPKVQKAIITGVKTLKYVPALGEFLKSKDSFVRDAAKETLFRLTRSNNKEIKQKATDELLRFYGVLDPVSMVKSFLDEGSNIIIFAEDHNQYSHRIMIKDIINSLQPGEVDYLALELSYYKQKIIDDELSKLKEGDIDSEKEVRKSLYKLVSSWFDPWLEKGIDAYVRMILAAHKKGIRIVCIDPRDSRVKYSSHKAGEMPVFVNPEKDGYVMVGGQRKATDEIMLNNILSLQGKVICLIGQQHAMNNWYRHKLPSLGTQIKQKVPSTKLILQQTIGKSRDHATEADNILYPLIYEHPVAIKNLDTSPLSNIETDLGEGSAFGKNGDAVIFHPLIRGLDIYEKVETIPDNKLLQNNIEGEKQNRDLLDKNI